MMKLLINYNANINSMDSFRRTAYYWSKNNTINQLYLTELNINQYIKQLLPEGSSEFRVSNFYKRFLQPA